LRLGVHAATTKCFAAIAGMKLVPQCSLTLIVEVHSSDSLGYSVEKMQVSRRVVEPAAGQLTIGRADRPS
jgi:hypothetical protein